MENVSYLFAVYTIIWVIFFGYLFYLHRRQQRLQREIDTLKKD
ncbi:MAG: CcmD family protein, partial [Dehalococcoidales bacterium]